MDDAALVGEFELNCWFKKRKEPALNTQNINGKIIVQILFPRDQAGFKIERERERDQKLI